MSSRTIGTRVIDVICEQMGLNGSDVTASTPLESLGIDSIDMVELAMALEEELEIEIADDLMEDWNTVQDVIDCVTEIAG